MRVSVVICTWNRCELLRDTLESLRALVVPPGEAWELLVVNNNSDDRTDDVLDAYRDLLPLRRLFEPELGVSRARNAAVRAAAGDLVLFTDDDVRVDSQWLRAYVEAAERWPDAGVFGGRIRSRFAAEVPGWVKRRETALAAMLSLRDLGSGARRLATAEFPFGPNMAVRRKSFELASFDERLGRKGAEQVRGSESSLFWRLQQRGVIGVWVPEAEVHHYIPRQRASLRYLWSYFHGGGRMAIRLEEACGVPPRRRPSRTRVALRTLAAFWRQPANWPSHIAGLAWDHGRRAESRRPCVRSISPNPDCGRESR